MRKEKMGGRKQVKVRRPYMGKFAHVAFIPPSIILAILILAAAIGYMWFTSSPHVNESIDSFEKCAAAGYPILESYPEQCRTPDEKIFVRKYCKTNFSYQAPGHELNAYENYSNECSQYRTRESCESAVVSFGCKWN